MKPNDEEALKVIRGVMDEAVHRGLFLNSKSVVIADNMIVVVANRLDLLDKLEQKPAIPPEPLK